VQETLDLAIDGELEEPELEELSPVAG